MRIEVEEVGLREGLQNLTIEVSLETKIEFVERAIKAGLDRIQLGSFVNPRKVPQMADTDTLCEHFIQTKPRTTFTALILNEKGLSRAVKSGVKHINISISASKTHQKKNTGMELDRALSEIERLIRSAKSNGMRVRGGIQAAFGCHYEGKVDFGIIREETSMIISAGVDEFGLSDTSGFATPASIKHTITLLKPIIEDTPVALHLHDTTGMGLANALYGIESGVTILDSSICGLGGCPFMEGAAGNIPTEDMVFMLKSFGMLGKVSMDKIIEFSRFIERKLGIISTSKIIHVYLKMKELGVS